MGVAPLGLGCVVGLLLGLTPKAVLLSPLTRLRRPLRVTLKSTIPRELARASPRASPHFSPIPGNGLAGARDEFFMALGAASPLSGVAVRRKWPWMPSAAAAERFLVRFCPNLDCRPCRALSASSIT